MRNAVLFTASILAICACAAALRLARLDNRLMHPDEANQAVKFGRLLEEGQYVYDPFEHHGPALNYLTLPVAWSTSAETLCDVSESQLRLVPALFGTLLVGLVWLVRDQLGRAAALCAAVLTAVSPAMVFHSRYYIHETLLVFFTFASMAALWRYASEATAAEPDDSRGRRRLRLRRTAWLVLLGLSLGMMHATKETCVIAIFAMLAAAALTMTDLRRLGAKRLALAGAIVLAVATGVSVLLFSSFFQNPRGVVDSLATYGYYVGRAFGEGSAGPHDHPWHYYFQLLFWWHRGNEPVWTEEMIAVLALVALVAAVLGKGLEPARLRWARFLAVYTFVMTAVYAAMPYKTPWCALGFLHGMILLAGIGAVVLVRAAPGRVFKGVVIAVLIVAGAHLAWQAHRASFTSRDDPDNPYVYAHTSRDVPGLAQRVEELAACHPDGPAMHVQVICRDDDYWPLPWYLRRMSRVGWFNRVPKGPAAPVIIAQSRLEPSVVNYVYVEQPPGQRHMIVPVIGEQGNLDWHLRLNVPLRLYARRDLWEAYQAETLPEM
jgi:uncharacterized protein (TIGR03663 family)